MASAQYETRTRTVEETIVVLRLTEDEADELRDEISSAAGTGRLCSVHRALSKPAPSEAKAPSDTFEYNGVTYEMGAVYQDADGDHFDFKAELSGPGMSGMANDRTPIGRFRGGYADGEPNDWGWTLGEVVDNHGPLTKVSA
ncbi:phiSA1p31-related protein [Streptomyces fulvorobeus]|uniref:Uncharacterized protein n=1 Tax=Streptomyces fulvorobeus TaxID=284028 RepID=A0A7J0CE16_9ACTN|nr:phiSA1p31-related protein [Streptomyces fulvorobeus]NYE44237.1 hypothetical protein [Streptomyces fulvorobeus]GFN00753.1 hypothetical protein Sfulv_55630 [Streptomyces fulvorobeus]